MTISKNTTYVGGDTVITWTGAGSDTWNVPAGVSTVTYLVVAGGGAGSDGKFGLVRGGGGGAGQVLTGTNFSVAGSLSVIVGAGGVKAAAETGADGNNSTFSSITATKGKGGGQSGGQHSGDGGASGSGKSGGNTDGSYGGGGGGDAANGANCIGDSNGGDGGAGTSSAITGTSLIYGVGGGGCGDNSPKHGGTGSADGGGHGGTTSAAGTDGTAGFGGGGGGCYNTGGCNGGSGCVIIRYTTPAAIPGFAMFI